MQHILPGSPGVNAPPPVRGEVRVHRLSEVDVLPRRTQRSLDFRLVVDEEVTVNESFVLS